MMMTLREGFVRMSARRLDPEVSYVYGISVPNVRPEHPSVNSQQYEWDQFEIADVDMTGIPVLANHKENMRRIGEIAAYEPLQGEARVLMALDHNTFYGKFAEAAVSTDFYGSMSLSHHFKTSAKVAAGGVVDAGTGYAPADVITRKTAIEVSLCQEPARPGAVVLEFCPSVKALMRQPRDYLYKFATKYRYPTPPEVPAAASGFVTEQIALNTPILHDYVAKRLAPLVNDRLAKLVDSAQFVRSDPILPSAIAHIATVEAGNVRMSNATPGATSSGGAGFGGTGNGATPSGASSTSSNNMQIDAPSSSAAANGGAQPPRSAASGNGMALDPTPASSTPAATSSSSSSSANKTASTESSTRVDLGSGDATPELPVLLATLHANNMAMKTRLDAYEAREKAAREAEEAQKKRLDAEKVKQGDLAAQTAISVFAENNKYTAAEKAALADAHKKMMDGAEKMGVPPSQRHDFVGPMFETMVRASKRARQDEEAARNAAVNETVRSIYEQIKASKSSATVHGGFTPSTQEYVLPSSGSVSASASATSTSSSMQDPAYLSVYGLTPEDYKRFSAAAAASSSSAGMNALNEGKVDASKSTVGRNNSRNAADDIKPDDPDAIGKVYASLCTLNADGTVTLPGYDELAVGGMVKEARVKRSANGEEQHFEVMAPRWSDKKRIGLQHLFPATFNKMQEPLMNYDAKLDEATLKKAVMLGKGAASNIIPEIHSRRRKGNFQKQFIYCDPRRRGTEEQSYVDIQTAQVFADGTPCV